MKNSLTRKLLLAVITLGIAVIATVGSTYAWFSMNTTVEATGVQLTATTPVNVVISKEENGTYTNAVEFSTHRANLYPASTSPELLTSSGVSFFAVQEGQVIGENGVGGVASSATKFQDVVISSATGVYADKYYFISEYLWLKTTAGKISLVLEEIELGDVDDAELIPSGATVDSAATIDSAGNLKYLKEALYIALITDDQTIIYSVDGENDHVLGVKAVASNGTWTPGETRELGSVGSNGTKVFNSASEGLELGTTPERVRVLVWLEGEDPDCLNAIGGLGLSIGLKFAYVQNSWLAE